MTLLMLYRKSDLNAFLTYRFNIAIAFAFTQCELSLLSVLVFLVTRGLLARKKYKQMLTIKKQQDEFIRRFFIEVENKASWLSTQLYSGREHDLDRQPNLPNNEQRPRELKDRRR